MSTPELSPAQRWLHRFPESTHNTVHGWFRHILSRGGTDPEAILRDVAVLIGRALDWAATPERRQLCENVLQALRCDRAGALAYAQRLIDEQGA